MRILNSTTCRRVFSSLLALAGLLWLNPALALERENWDIRVVLTDSKSSLQVGGSLSWTADGKPIGSSTDAVDIKRAGDGVKLVIGSKGYTASRLVAVPTKNMCRWNSHNYRGRFELFAAKREGGVVLLNVLPLELYLLGGVGCEMPASWPPEALKAQAVAARTYAVSRMLARAELSFDVYSNQSDQMYLGYDREDPRVTAAVEGTAGQILTYEGNPISAMYCSDCGTCTRNGKAPYLKSVPSPAPDSPNANWTVSLSQSELSSLVAKAGGKIGRVTLVEAENDPQSGHLLRLNCTGEHGCYSIGANELRTQMGLSVVKSTQIVVKPADGKAAPRKDGGKGKDKALPQSKKDKYAPKAPLESIEVQAAAYPEEDNGGSDEGGDLSAATASSEQIVVDGEGRQVSISVLQGYSKPWIAWTGGQGAAKLKLLYCYDGDALARCNREICVITPGGSTGSGEVLARSSAGTPAGTQKLYDPNEMIFPEMGTVKYSDRQLPLDTPELPPASTTLNVSEAGILLCGSGYGHGVGMSQYGAKALASNGYTWQDILLHFYSGVQLEPLVGDLNGSFIADAQIPAQRERTGAVVEVAVGEGEPVPDEELGEAVEAGGGSEQGEFYDPFRKP